MENKKIINTDTFQYEEFLELRDQAIDKLKNDPNFRIIVDDSRYYTDK